MTRVLLPAAVVMWCGATLVLSQLRWFSRPHLVERLRPYTPGQGGPASTGVLSVESFRDVLGPLARGAGTRLARLFGVSEELSLRLKRIHSPLDVTEFRLRQIGWATAAFGAGAFLVLGLRPPGPLALVLTAGPALVAFLVLEQQVAAASQQRQRRLMLELPVVAEQLAMLLSAGYSLGAALNRLAARGDASSVSIQDLRRVCTRIRHGLTEVDALREWARLMRVDALDRLVPVLALNREASDLGRLISGEARAVRRDLHRQLVETMERRSQQVWIPVTVATLVPGVVFMAIPFIEALRVFSGS
ncbi:MAG: tight adherence protein [Actinomycetota bacterium]|nr:tight adherence protein [Actinomycetota bacterium]